MPIPTVHIACNGDGGHFEGRAAMISVGDIQLEARGIFDRPPTLAHLPGAIRLAGKVWPIDGWQEHVGNWCWNAYSLKPTDGWATPRWKIAQFLIWLRGRGLYTVDTAPERFFEWWKGERDLSPAEVHHEVVEALR